MKQFIMKIATIISLSILLIGCGDNESSKPAIVTTGLTMTGSGQPAVAQTNFNKMFSLFLPSAIALTPPAMVDSQGATVTMNSAWIVIKSIEFEANEISDVSEVDGDEVELTGPFYVDLLSSLPLSFGDVQVPAAGLRRIKMKLHKADTLPATAPTGLTNNSIYLTFTRSGSNSFTYQSDDTAKFEIGGPNPVVPNNTEDLLVEIKSADLIKKINLSGIANSTIITASARQARTNPCPLIDPSAADLYTCFRKGLENQANFGSDDGDFDLDVNDESVD